MNADEWLLYWRVPDKAPARRKRRALGLMQPFLFNFPLEEKAVGANETGLATLPRSPLHLVKRPSETEEQ